MVPLTSEGGLGSPSAVTLMGLSRMMPLDTAEEDESSAAPKLPLTPPILLLLLLTPPCSAGGGSLWGSEKGSPPAPAPALVFLAPPLPLPDISSEPEPDPDPDGMDTDSELATLSSARIGPPGAGTGMILAAALVGVDDGAAADGGGATSVGGPGSLDEATTVACPEAVTLLGSMDDSAGSRFEVEEVEVDVCGGGPIEEVDGDGLVLVLVVVGAVDDNIVLVCAGAALVAACLGFCCIVEL